MDDFADSYEQRKWKYATESYQRWIKAMNLARSPKAKEMCQNMINNLLREYPQLVK